MRRLTLTAVVPIVAVLGLAGTIGLTSANARTIKVAKHPKTRLADRPAQPPTPTMRYYGGPKSPMWPGTN